MRRRGTRACCGLLALLAVLGGCGGGQPPVEAPVVEGDPAPAPTSGTSLAVESEIGAMDEHETQRVFERSANRLARCLDAGRRRVPYLAGEIRLSVRVAVDGTVRWAYVKDSTLGDRDTEACMLAVMKAMKWPKPVGGGEGLAENSFTFEPNPEERPPVAWAPEQLGKATGEVMSSLSSCRQSAGTGALKVTLHVDPEGKLVTAGVSGSDERAEAAAQCVVDALREVKFPSPGSYDAKVSVEGE